MTFPQLAILLLLGGLLVAFATERFRIEVVALSGLAVGAALGLVPLQNVFDGLANPAVITVAEILLLTAVVARSPLIDVVTRRLLGIARSERTLIALICVSGAATSAFMNNIGALALWLPVAFSLCRSTGVTPAKVLMPLSFATLLGGTCSLIGTPANLVVSGFQFEAAGRPFSFFELAWVGVPVTIAGVAWLVIAAPRLLNGGDVRDASSDSGGARHFFAELRVTGNSTLAGLPPAETERALQGLIHTHLRANRHVFGDRRTQIVQPGDILLIEARADVISKAIALRQAEFALTEESVGHVPVEAVVLPQSVIIGSAIGTIEAFRSRDIEVVAIATRLQRIEGRLADLQIRVGDILLLSGPPDAVFEALAETDCLALSRQSGLNAKSEGWFGVLAFVGAIILAATNMVPPEIAFGAAILLLLARGTLDLRSAISELNWPVLLMLAAMIPLGEAVASTGLAEAVARQTLDLLGSANALALTAAVLVSAVAITPFVNNVSAAITLAPVAGALANAAGLAPEPLLLAVAVGVSLDFLTPFGHHNNTLVMSVGSYRFRDFFRLGAPLVAISSLTALLAIHLFFR